MEIFPGPPISYPLHRTFAHVSNICRQYEHQAVYPTYPTLPSVFIAGLPLRSPVLQMGPQVNGGSGSRLEVGPARLAAVYPFDSVSSNEVEICQQAAEVGSGYKNGPKRRKQRRKCSQIFLSSFFPPSFFFLPSSSSHVRWNPGLEDWEWGMQEDGGCNWCLDFAAAQGEIKLVDTLYGWSRVSGVVRITATDPSGIAFGWAMGQEEVDGGWNSLGP